MDFSREIAHLATHNSAYDPQCDSRARYVLSLIKEGQLQDKIATALSESIPRLPLDNWSWDAAHQLHLARLLVQEGCDHLKETLYQSYNNPDAGDGFYVFERDIIECDRFQGLLAVAERNGQALSQGADFFPHFWTCEKAVKSSLKELEQATATNPAVKLFLAAYLQYQERETSRAKARAQEDRNTYQLVRQSIEQGKTPVPARWVRDLSEEQLLMVAKAFLEERDKRQQSAYLTIFAKRQFPLGAQPLLKLLTRPVSATLLTTRLLDALALCSAPEVRSLALEVLKNRRLGPASWHLLKHNYQEGDGQLLAAKIRSFRSQHKIHAAALSCTDIYSQQTTKDCREPLLALYRTCSCSLCRGSIVHLLQAAGVCPPEIAEEFPYDAYCLGE